jgi:hypothetical protein
MATVRVVQTHRYTGEVRDMRIEPGRLSRATGVGVGIGSMYGAFELLGGRSLLTGVITGLIVATVMAASFYASLGRGPTHLSGLNYGQRNAVTRAVRLGRGVDDPALAEATIRHAGWVQRSARPQGWMIVLVWSLLGASGLALVAALVWGDTYVAFAGALSVVVWTVILLVGPRVERRRLARAQKAEAETVERLGSVDLRS